MPDVEMKSVESDTYQQIHRGAEYDPDDLWMPKPRVLHVAATGMTTGVGRITQMIRISQISELEEFSGKDREVDKAETWIGKVKSAFIRDQAPDEEICLVFGDLIVGPARYWYRQLIDRRDSIGKN